MKIEGRKVNDSIDCEHDWRLDPIEV